MANAGIDEFDVITRRFDDFGFKGSDLNLAAGAKTVISRSSMPVGHVALNSNFLASVGGQVSHALSLSPLTVGWITQNLIVLRSDEAFYGFGAQVARGARRRG